MIFNDPKLSRTGKTPALVTAQPPAKTPFSKLELIRAVIIKLRMGFAGVSTTECRTLSKLGLEDTTAYRTNDFGFILDSNNIEQHVEFLRSGIDKFAIDNPAELKRIRAIVDSTQSASIERNN